MVDTERRRSGNKQAMDVRAFFHFEMHKVNPIPQYPPQLWLFERNINKEEKKMLGNKTHSKIINKHI